jgi:hypothetical protein
MKNEAAKTVITLSGGHFGGQEHEISSDQTLIELKDDQGGTWVYDRKLSKDPNTADFCEFKPA